MRKNDEFTLKNEEYDDNARAVNESELLPIYEAMNFSGDIQPLDDFEIAEPKAADYQQKKKNEPKGSENKKEKRIFNFNFGTSKRTARLIVTVAAVIVTVVAAGIGIYLAASNRGGALPVKTIYDSGSKTYLVLEDDSTYEIPNVQKIEVSSDGSRIFYCKNTSSKIGTYDIKLIDTAKKRSLEHGGSVISVGAGEKWETNDDATLLSYSKKEKGTVRYYLYSTEEGKSVEIASEIEDVFLPSKGDVVYYTRRVNSIYSLHRIKFGEESSSVVSGIENVNFYDSEEGSEVLYTVSEKDTGNIDVFSVKGLEEPKEICSEVAEVYLNDYEYGGNLYYFTKKNSAVNWQDFVSDKYSESDGAMKEPVESDYMIEYGFFVKRYILNESSFNAAKTKYNAKLKRDAIREALNKLDFGMDAGVSYDCHVHNAFIDQTLATGIFLDNMLAYSKTGAPRIVYRKSVINVDNMITMDELMSMTSGTDTADAMEYVRKNVGKSYTVSNDCIYSWFDGNKTLQFTFNDYKNPNTIFHTASSTLLYGFFDGKLYCDSISTAEFGKPKRIAEKVSDCSFNNEFVYYQKMIDDSNTGFFRYSPDTGEQYLGDNVSSFIIMNDNCVILMSLSENLQSTMDINVFDGVGVRAVDRNISMNHFIYNGNTIAYLKTPADDSSRESGDMYVWSAGNDPTKTGENISAVRYIKDLYVS